MRGWEGEERGDSNWRMVKHERVYQMVTEMSSAILRGEVEVAVESRKGGKVRRRQETARPTLSNQGWGTP